MAYEQGAVVGLKFDNTVFEAEIIKFGYEETNLQPTVSFCVDYIIQEDLESRSPFYRGATPIMLLSVFHKAHKEYKVWNDERLEAARIEREEKNAKWKKRKR